jgi:WhiB family transcriptional regulator, redox-sensing transcriptional regulator
VIPGGGSTHRSLVGRTLRDPCWIGSRDEGLDEVWGDDTEAWQSPARSDDELTWTAPDTTPVQDPKLSANEANHITKALAAQATVEWLMGGSGPELVTFANLFHRPDWMAGAECRGMDANLFVPALGQSTAIAKAVCASCEVRVECLDAAMADETTEGIWGGLGQRKRRQMRRGSAVAQ